MREGSQWLPSLLLVNMAQELLLPTGKDHHYLVIPLLPHEGVGSIREFLVATCRNGRMGGAELAQLLPVLDQLSLVAAGQLLPVHVRA